MANPRVSPQSPIRFQFSLRVVLLLMALVAITCWWFLAPKSNPQVTLGMTEQAVMERLGSPWDVRTEGQAVWWSYPANTSADYESGELLIRFGNLDKKVIQISRLKQSHSENHK